MKNKTKDMNWYLLKPKMHSSYINKKIQVQKQT